MTELGSGEILFIKCVKDGIPNRDPLNDSDARRLFGSDDGRISLSDVSIKRDVRDYVLARYPDGAGNKFIYCREERTEDGKLLGRESLGSRIVELADAKDEDRRTALPRLAFDVRTFGAVYSVSKQSFHLTGPVQFGWAHSLHPVDTRYVQGTTVMPSTEGEKSKGQGTIWTMYTLPFAVFAMPAVINGTLMQQTGMTGDDIDLLLEALWKGTLHRQARGRGIQQPLLLIHVQYSDPFFRLGFLEDRVRLLPGRETWLGGNPPTALAETSLDVSELAMLLQGHLNNGNIAQLRYWHNDALTLNGDMPGNKQDTW